MQDRRDIEDLGDIDGLVFRYRGEIIKNKHRNLIENIDTLPFPARHLIDYGRQAGHSVRGFSNTIRSAEVFTSRGCPIGCIYCAIQTTFGKKVRFHSIEYIEEDIRECLSRHGVNHIVMADDTFTLMEERTLAICDIFRRQQVDSWNCDTRVNSVTKKLLLSMKDSGCKKIAYGVESGSPRILDLIGKKINIEQVKNAVYLAKEAGIRHIEGNFIIGSHPSETIEDINKTRHLIKTLPWTFVSVTIIVPYPGTPV